MSTWTLEPRDTLVLRDGRPMQGASAMMSLRIPFPSSTAGFFRTRAGSDAHGLWNGSPERAKQTAVHGPWLVELDDHDSVATHYLPAPRDCVCFAGPSSSSDPSAWRAALAPLQLPDGAEAGLPDGVTQMCGFRGDEDAERLRQKPTPPPAFWRWDGYAAWLASPRSGPVDFKSLGFGGAQIEVRTHVAIDADSQTARDGALFSLEHVRFVVPRASRLPGRLGLAVDFPDDDKRGGLRPGTYAYAGERRLVHLRKAQDGTRPKIPAGLLDAIASDGKVRVILVTPGHFEEGWRPRWLLEPRDGVTPHLVSACVDRPVTVSGWDMAAPKGGQPKPTRRLASAGSVYFIALDGSADARRAWVQRNWWKPVSDSEGSRLEGFGLAAIGSGVWT